jgi:hypothetical protein
MARFIMLDHDDCGDHAIGGHNVAKENVIFLRGCKD